MVLKSDDDRYHGLSNKSAKNNSINLLKSNIQTIVSWIYILFILPFFAKQNFRLDIVLAAGFSCLVMF